MEKSSPLSFTIRPQVISNRSSSESDVVCLDGDRPKRGEGMLEEILYLYQDKQGFEKTFISQEKGFGLVATRFFEKGSFLMFYRGKRITKEECDQRMAVRIEKLIQYVLLSKMMANFLFKFQDGTNEYIITDKETACSSMQGMKVPV